MELLWMVNMFIILKMERKYANAVANVRDAKNKTFFFAVGDKQHPKGFPDDLSLQY